MSLPAAGALGALLSAALTAPLCLPGALAIDRGLLPLNAAEPWALGAAGAAVCLAVLLLGRLRRRQALPLGGIAAGGALLLAALLCALAGELAAFGPWLWRLALAFAAGGVLGSVLAVRQNPHRKRRR